MDNINTFRNNSPFVCDSITLMANIDYIDKFLDNLLYHKKYSDKTITSYKRDLEQLDKSIEGKDIVSISSQDIQLWIKKEHSKGSSAKTLQRKLSTVRSFLIS